MDFAGKSNMRTAAKMIGVKIVRRIEIRFLYPSLMYKIAKSLDPLPLVDAGLSGHVVLSPPETWFVNSAQRIHGADSLAAQSPVAAVQKSQKINKIFLVKSGSTPVASIMIVQTSLDSAWFRRLSAAVGKSPQTAQISESCVCGARCGLAMSIAWHAGKLATEVVEAALRTLSVNWRSPFCVR